MARSDPPLMAGTGPVVYPAMDEHAAGRLAKALKALADPVRLRMLSMLAQVPDGRVSASAIAEPVGRSNSTVSHHLKALREVGLIRAERQGSIIWYSLRRDRFEELLAMLNLATLPAPERPRGPAAGPRTTSFRSDYRPSGPHYVRGGEPMPSPQSDSSRPGATRNVGLPGLRCDNPDCVCSRGRERPETALR